MNPLKKLLLATTLLVGVIGALTGCNGYVETSGYYGDPFYGPGYYGHDRWYDDGPWMDGPRGYVGIGIHPMRR